MTKILKKIIDVIFILLIILLAGYFILRITNNIIICEVETGSMEDGIHAGDYILIYKKTSYKVGDVVTFKKDGYYITHRIVKKKGQKVITKGDANNIEDDEMNVNNIVGKVFISGGILNTIINFKYAIASLFIAIYLITYYLDKNEKEKKITLKNYKDNKSNITDKTNKKIKRQKIRNNK